ncbi:hypothetical protein SAMN05421803_1485 [Nocardiopsis flavescens]|uniref:Uncharacterized protein n=1 Tax=Nocardiopsis flavescens TaxID=758803 RepID=A0A1M6WP65_9ACTN|nr:hypothetical protein [Nocardiopsis flavescens]SHK95325.1 hypothetical protein SAMN05421803_1485 [Nocardiopsis flavescens]
MPASSALRPWGSAAVHLEVAVPGAAIGAVAGLFATGVGMAAGLPAAMTGTAGLALGLPLAVLGAAYSVLLARGVFPIGAVAPLALYWLLGFPAAQLFDAHMVAWVTGAGSALREPLPSFLLLQAMLSLGFTIGFLWLHERTMPHWLMRVRGHNPVAEALFQRYVEHAAHLQRRRGPGRAPRGRRRPD